MIPDSKEICNKQMEGTPWEEIRCSKLAQSTLTKMVPIVGLVRNYRVAGFEGEHQ